MVKNCNLVEFQNLTFFKVKILKTSKHWAKFNILQGKNNSGIKIL